MDDATGRVKGPGTRKRGTSAVADAKPVDPSLPAETDERARELRVEIAETRGEMSETIEAIQERLKPSNIVENAKESVQNATTEKVKQMANTAEYAADRVMNNTFMDTVRDNPVPAAMIGLGAAWLLMKGRSDSRGDGNRCGTTAMRTAAAIMAAATTGAPVPVARRSRLRGGRGPGRD